MTFGLLAVAAFVALVLAVAAVLLLLLPRLTHPGRETVVRGVGQLAGELGKVFAALAREIRPGVTTLQLEHRVEHLLRARDLRGYLKGYGRYPALITASVNDEVANTLPSSRLLADGDLLKLQVGVSDGTFYAVQGWTFVVGMPTAEDVRLMDGARTALDTAVAAAIAGRSSADLTAVIQRSLAERGLRASRDVTGHQIGLVPRKGPSLPCAAGVGGEHPTPLTEGMVLSVVVVAHAGEPAVAVADDGWNLVAIDGTRSAHFSHLVVVRRATPERLTAAPG